MYDRTKQNKRICNRSESGLREDLSRLPSTLVPGEKLWRGGEAWRLLPCHRRNRGQAVLEETTAHASSQCCILFK